ncbi:uncharacterized protein LOC131358886 isoform X1 [Hemibagrus wyckioides]|uniref:uncharacterized protein LOC131358886 isoform X1 n=1 Tax=Hemibagrus wyckioides TaxID=337641 RepID=UPI00266B41C1|nr:uncharacterized protein LOC131358886 isoform X1 [Hemibagrus wyckioides]
MANPWQPAEVNFQTRWNLRRAKECFIRGQHVSLQRLKERRSRNKMAEYLLNEIPPYPTPAEFWVSEVTHVTEESGFEGILESEQFSPIAGEFSWWGLKINEDEIKAAEKRYMETNFPNEAQDLNEQRPFLEKFTTSPPFQLEVSRYGNYRFSFPLTDLMQWYKEQNCGGEDPVLRVYETVTYRQEIMYTVLIHSPEDNQRFGEYPLLEASEWVQYQDGKIIWKAQAICETHRYQFISGEVQRLNPYLYYVWDHVSLVFHLPKPKAMKISIERLIEALEVCKLDEIDLSRYEGPKNKEERFQEADMKVSELKRDLENIRMAVDPC